MAAPSRCALNRCMTSSRNNCSGARIEINRRPPSATIDGTNARLAAHSRGQNRRNRIDERRIGSQIRARPIGHQPDLSALNLHHHDLFTRMRRRRPESREDRAMKAAASRVPRSDVTPRTSASASGTDARVASRRQDFLHRIEIERELLARDVERHQHLGFCRCLDAVLEPLAAADAAQSTTIRARALRERRLEQRLDIQNLDGVAGRGLERSRRRSPGSASSSARLASMRSVAIDTSASTASTTSATRDPTSRTTARAVGRPADSGSPSIPRSDTTGSTDPRRLAIPRSAAGLCGTRVIGGTRTTSATSSARSA